MKAFGGLFIVIFGLAGAMLPPIGYAAGGGGGGDFGVDNQPTDPDYTRGVQAAEAKHWDEAINLFMSAMKRDEKNADILNYLGYVERNRGNMNKAFDYYQRALAINPKHRGAHEYLGEAYLMTGNVAKAEEQLAALDKLCFFTCKEYRELKEKIAEFKEKKQQAAR